MAISTVTQVREACVTYAILRAVPIQSSCCRLWMGQLCQIIPGNANALSTAYHAASLGAFFNCSRATVASSAE